MTAESCARCGARSDEGGWCGCCGADLRPGSVTGRFSRVAQERATLWAEEPESARADYARRGGDAGAPPPSAAPVAAPEGTKCCPRCAEDVKAAAEVCRYCGHEFGARATSEPWRSDAQTSGLAVGAYTAARDGDVWGALRLANEAESEIRRSGGRITGDYYVEEARNRVYNQIAISVVVLVVAIVAVIVAAT